MINGNALYNRCSYNIAKLYTLFLKGSFRHLGRGSVIFFPNRFEYPQKMSFGENVVIHSNCYMNVVEKWADRVYDGELRIGNNVVISNNCQISVCSKITLGNNIAIGKNCVIVDHIHDYRVLDRPIFDAPVTQGQPVVIEDDGFIGNNTVIAPGITIGRHCFIGANSVVLSDIPPLSMASGNPARVLKVYDQRKKMWIKIRS